MDASGIAGSHPDEHKDSQYFLHLNNLTIISVWSSLIIISLGFTIDCDLAAWLQVIEGERLMVLAHVLSGGYGIYIGRQFEHAKGDFDGLGEEVFQAADSPTEWQFPLVQKAGLLVLNDDINHPSALLYLIHFHFFLYDGLDLLFL